MSDVLELLRQFGAADVGLDALDEVSTGDLRNYAEEILADDGAKLGLGAALCARREKQDGDCEDFLVDGASYPFFDGCSSAGGADWWASAAVPAIGAYIATSEEVAQESVRETIGRLVVKRLWLDTDPDKMTDEETAAWAAIGLDMDALKKAAQAIKDEAENTEEDGSTDENQEDGADPQDRSPDDAAGVV